MYNQQKSTIQKLLDENSQLILLMIDLLAKGKQNECLEHQRTLHRNLTYLIQFDPVVAAQYSNNLPSPQAFNQSDTSKSPFVVSPIDFNSYPIQSNILNPINKPGISQQRSSYPVQQTSYGQYSQSYLTQQQWSNQSRASTQP